MITVPRSIKGPRSGWFTMKIPQHIVIYHHCTLRQWATVNRINHPDELNSEVPFLPNKMPVLLLKLMKRHFLIF